MAEKTPHKDALERLAGKTGRVYWPIVTEENIMRQIIEKDFPGFSMQYDSELKFTSENHPEFCKHAPFTVRYAPQCVRLPKHPERDRYLDAVLITNDVKKTLGYIAIDGEVVVWRVKNFPKKAAQLCGFEDQFKMVKALSSMYNNMISPTDSLSLYRIKSYYSLEKKITE